MTIQQANRDPCTGNKAEYVREMFASIAHRYDLLNDILSFNRHKAWRRYAVRLANLRPGDRALDVCTGTGDFALDLFRAVGPTGPVIGADFCLPMVRKGQEKTDPASGGRILMMIGDTLRLPYRSDSFDCVTVGFGIRNVEDVQQAFAEMARVARPGGRVICLEFNTPRSRFWRPLVDFYELKVLPRIGALLSRREAYTYLPESIQVFHSREELARMMENVGLTDVRVFDLNLGSVCIHLGIKR
jgi:demethylmenaquinone methyltransferase/2-methoxy-6-polyprenyl-1,4-benzoquinol methylase